MTSITKLALAKKTQNAAIKTVSSRLHKFHQKIPINSKIASVNKTLCAQRPAERARDKIIRPSSPKTHTSQGGRREQAALAIYFCNLHLHTHTMRSGPRDVQSTRGIDRRNKNSDLIRLLEGTRALGRRNTNSLVRWAVAPATSSIPPFYVIVKFDDLISRFWVDI
jgi:hypothetical protein